MVPTRNRNYLLRESLVSILNQTYQNIEIIVSDNFPDSNETEEYIKTIDDNRIKYIRQKNLIPMSEHWNVLVNRANGDYICIYHDDDIYTENIVETSVNCFLEKKNVLLCHVANRHFKDDIKYAHPLKITHIKKYMSNVEYLEYCLKNKPSIMCPSVMYPRWIFKKYKFKDIYKSFDYHFWFELMNEDGLIAYNSESLMYYRKHASNSHKNDLNKQKVIIEYNTMIKESFRNSGIKDKIKNFEKKLENYTKKEIVRSHIGRKNIFNIKRTFDFIRKINKTEININFYDVLLFAFIKK